MLEFALNGLNETTLKVLDTIAAFRMPASYDTLVALLVGEDKPCTSEDELIAILIDLEDRGLLGWDRRANRYDLHPIVRGVTWSGLGDHDKKDIYKTLNAHFESLPMIDLDHWQEVNSLEDLTAAIELYNTLIGLGRYDDAAKLFDDRLNDAMRYNLGAYRQHAELLHMLFPNGLDQLPLLSRPVDQSRVLNDLALSIKDQPGLTAQLYRRSFVIFDQEGEQLSASINLSNLSIVLRLSGALCNSEATGRRALLISRQLRDQYMESEILSWLGLVLAVRGRKFDSERALERSRDLSPQGISFISYDCEAERACGLENMPMPKC